MRYQYPDKQRTWDIFQMILYIVFFLIMLGVGIWYQWLDISTKLAIRDMARQQQESRP